MSSPAGSGKPTPPPQGPTSAAAALRHKAGNKMPSESPIRVISGNGNRRLADLVCRELNVGLTKCTVDRRACGEVNIVLEEPVRGSDVYIVQSTAASDSIDINTAVLELLFLIRRVKLEGASRITAIVPFFGYARQDRKCDLRGPISAQAMSAMISQMGVDRVVVLDLHAGQIQGYFNGHAPLDNLQMAHEFAQYIRTCRWFEPSATVIVSPDAGGVARAHAFADLLGVSHIVTIMKRRARAGVVESMQTVGDVKGYSCIIIDDMVDTGGTLVAACKLLKDMGAARVVACITHGILTDPCSDRVNKCDELEELVVSDSMVQAANQAKCKKLQVLTIAPMLAQAIMVYHTEQSISDLFTRPATPMPRHALPPTGGAGISPLSQHHSPFPQSGSGTPPAGGQSHTKATTPKSGITPRSFNEMQLPPRFPSAPLAASSSSI